MTTPTYGGELFRIEGPRGRVLAAGPVLRFRTFPENERQGYSYTWHVQGPRSTDNVAFPGPAVLDWDTAGLAPGTYEIWCVRTAAQPPGDSPPAPPVSVVDEGGGIGTYGTAPVMPPPASVAYGGEGGIRDQDHSNHWEVLLEAPSAGSQSGVLPVSLQRTQIEQTLDQILWVVIRNRTNAIGFRPYKQFVDGVMCHSPRLEGPYRGQPLNSSRELTFRGPDAYDVLRRATDIFLMHEVGVLDDDDGPTDRVVGATAALDSDLVLDDIERQLGDPSSDLVLEVDERRRLERRVTLADLRRLRDNYYERLTSETDFVLPYLMIIRNRLSDIPLKPADDLAAPNCYGLLRSNLLGPLAIELIWAYWHEEGMLAQTLNAIVARFENRRLVLGRPDPLARFDLDPLRPLNNILWGWVQDEFRRLTVRRRSFEYDHEYGLRLIGRAVPEARVVDRRSKFLESFHNLLYLSHIFYKEDDDTTVLADGFPLLNALRETHLLLAEGAHNQFGDLPSTARAEMLVMQWLLARPEMRDFLGGRVMVPYEEEWMDRVDSMKSMQGWTDVSVTHFRDMGVYGEQLLLSVRYGNWSTVNDPQQAANWARYWRPEVQRYTHAYRSATGVDLTERLDARLPSELLAARLGRRRRA